MATDREAVDAKVTAIFREWAGDRADRLRGSRPASEAMDRLAAGLALDYPPEKAKDIAFHLADWNADAAFLVAVHLFPERFTAAEVSAAARALLIHVPAHVAEAARIAGFSSAQALDAD